MLERKIWEGKLMKRKVRTIQQPLLPEGLSQISLSDISNETLVEIGKVTYVDGPIEAEHVRFEEVHFRNVNLTGSKLPFSSWSNSILEDCDLSHVDFSRTRFHRVLFKNCKLAGTDFDQTELRDVYWQECQAPYALFNQMDMRDVCFTNCLLKGANFLDSKWDYVQFGHSTIDDVQFTGTSLKNVDLSNCQFTTIHTNAEEIKGAIISAEQAVSFIELFGVKVKD